MKRLLIALVIFVPLAVGALAAATWVFGSLTKKGFQAEADGQPSLFGRGLLLLDLEEYERGYLESDATSKVTVATDMETPIPLLHRIHHGPLAMTPDGVEVGMAYVVTTLNREALPADGKEELTRLYGDEDPVRLGTRVPFAGGRTIEADVAAVNLDDPDTAVNFDGGFGRVRLDGDGNPLEGNLELSPVSGRWTDADGSHRAAFDGVELTLDPSRSPQLQGTVGQITASSESPNGDPVFSLETAAIEIESDQRFLDEHPDVPVGSYRVSMPEMSVTIADTKPVTLSNFSAESKSELADGMLAVSATYGIESVGWEVPDPSFKPYQPLWQDGFSLSVGGRFPIEFVHQMTLAQEAVGPGGVGARDLARVAAFADSLESAAHSVAAGTGLEWGLEFGSDSEHGALNVSITYTGKEPITEQKTYLELVKHLRVEVDAAIPSVLVANVPAIQQALQPLLASGALVETPEGLRMEARLEDGTLVTNGQPNPFFQQMKPFLVGKIQWDALFDGMREAAEAQ